MAYSNSRSAFIRGRLSDNSHPIRPPWASPGDLFLTLCTRCHECIERCPGKILKPGSGGFPETDYSRGGCDFCGDCLRACSKGALKHDPRHPSTPWLHKAHISDRCLSLNGVVCRACGDACEPRAISFRLKPGGVSEPAINSDSCTGCGECLSVCPAGSIQFSTEQNREDIAYKGATL